MLDCLVGGLFWLCGFSCFWWSVVLCCFLSVLVCLFDIWLFCYFGGDFFVCCVMVVLFGFGFYLWVVCFGFGVVEFVNLLL